MASTILSNAFKEEFCSRLLTWYRKFGRDLPWRKTDNPYHILVSEIFLHQTQVKTVIKFYNKFFENVARNRGINLRVFTKKEDAIEWMNSK